MAKVRRLLSVALGATGATLAACGFDLQGSAEGDASPPDAAIVDAAQQDAPDGPSVSPTFVPSHVPPSAFDGAAIDMSDVTDIDTDVPKITTGGGSSPPKIVIHGSFAVVSAGAWTVGSNLRVHGSHPLVVVCARGVVVKAMIDVAARLDQPGAGGAAPGAGSGKGGDGVVGAANIDTGGGGAGFGVAGAAGGGDATYAGGAAGAAYGGALADLAGGSGGGHGSDSTYLKSGVGGAGGGAIQISSALSIEIAAGGVIDVGGGGGGGGQGAPYGGAGGGGGSGGTIFLEAPALTIAGSLAANGGGGGGAGVYNVTPNGAPGANGSATATPASGGAGQGGQGNGGTGGALGAAPTTPATATNNGGGGGATGVVWLRTSRVDATVSAGAVVTPRPRTDKTL